MAHDRQIVNEKCPFCHEDIDDCDCIEEDEYYDDFDDIETPIETEE